MLILVLAVFFDYDIILFDIKTFFLHGRLLEAEQIYMEAIPGQGLKSGHINRVVGSLYGHPVAAYRAQIELKKCLLREGLFVQADHDSCLFIMKHKTERFWIATHVDDMPSSGTTGGRNWRKRGSKNASRSQLTTNQR
jgi:hypothetical protein